MSTTTNAATATAAAIAAAPAFWREWTPDCGHHYIAACGDDDPFVYGLLFSSPRSAKNFFAASGEEMGFCGPVAAVWWAADHFGLFMTELRVDRDGRLFAEAGATCPQREHRWLVWGATGWRPYNGCATGGAWRVLLDGEGHVLATRGEPGDHPDLGRALRALPGVAQTTPAWGHQQWLESGWPRTPTR